MKCRNLSEKNHNIIWFGKDMESPTTIYYMKKDRTFGYGTDLDTIAQSFKIDGTTYYYKLGANSLINGTFGSESNFTTSLGKCTLTTPKLPNYVEDTDAVVASLIQRLSVIKGELWWQVNYGMPLTDKVRGTTLYDMVVTDIITSHPGVASIQSYSSNLVGHTYTYTCTIKTVFGDTATISN